MAQLNISNSVSAIGHTRWFLFGLIHYNVMMSEISKPLLSALEVPYYTHFLIFIFNPDSTGGGLHN